MSLNLGTPACVAARSLAANPDFLTIRAAIAELVRQKMNIALEVPDRVDGTAYVRALRDLHMALESAATGVAVNQVAKPSPLKPAKAAADADV